MIRRQASRFVLAVLLTAFALVALASSVAASTLSPDAARAIFQANAVGIMFLWGLLHKYVPALKKLENDLIPWANFVGYVFATLFAPSPANADALFSTRGAVSSLPDAIGVLVAGGTNSALAALLFDKFAKPWLDRVFGRPPRRVGT